MQVLVLLFLLWGHYPNNQNVEIPKLKKGTLDEAINYGVGRRLSGFMISEFRVTREGKVDSVKITSTYYGRNIGAEKESIDKKNESFFRSLNFEPLSREVWVQVKVYVYFHNSSTGDPRNYEATADHFRTFDYGFKKLHENELETYFTTEEGRRLEYIIKNGRVIFAPLYLYGIT